MAGEVDLGRLAVLGGGKLGEAILSGIIRAGAVQPEAVTCADPDAGRRKHLGEALGVATTDDNLVAVTDADVVLVAVKPQVVPSLLAEVGRRIRPPTTVVSVAAGIPTSTYEARLSPGVAMVRVMPNTPVLVDEGMSVLAPGTHAGPTDLARAEAMLGRVGRVRIMAEHHLDAVTALSGSGPAYVFMLAEALVEAGVLVGLGREDASELAIQTLVGASLLLRDGGQHPAVLREMVTSPGGTTAAGLRALERAGVRGAILDAVAAATDRSVELGRAAQDGA